MASAYLSVRYRLKSELGTPHYPTCLRIEIRKLKEEIRVNGPTVARSITLTNRALEIKGINTGQGEMTEERAIFIKDVRDLLRKKNTTRLLPNIRTTDPVIRELEDTRDQLYQRRGNLALVIDRCNKAVEQFKRVTPLNSSSA